MLLNRYNRRKLFNHNFKCLVLLLPKQKINKKIGCSLEKYDRHIYFSLRKKTIDCSSVFVSTENGINNDEAKLKMI